MATRSYIGVRNSDNTVDYIYCHYDGYPSNNGKILIEYYNDPTKVSELLSLGDLSVLAPAIGEKHDFDSREDRYSNWCLAYGRDRGEPNTQMKTRPFSELINDDSVDYVYVFYRGIWECYDTYNDEAFNLYAQTL